MSTRIADLPDNITMQQMPNLPMQQQQQQHQGSPRNSVISSGIKQTSQLDQSLSNTYMPMNIHPNPFSQGQGQNLQQSGSSTGDMPLPQNVHQSMDSFRNTGQQEQRLPSRDIPMDSIGYTHDESIQANYKTPVSESTEDYIKIYEENKHKKMKNFQEEKFRKETADDLVVQFQTPIFVALLYFIFQMPIFNQILYKYLSRLPIFKPDGNINLYGMILKSVGFASIYYSMEKIITYLQFL